MTMRTILIALVALFGLAVLGGCGEDSAKGAAEVSKEMPKSNSKEPDMPPPPGGMDRGDGPLDKK